MFNYRSLITEVRFDDRKILRRGNYNTRYSEYFNLLLCYIVKIIAKANVIYNNKKDNQTECRVLISAMLDSNYLKISSEYNLAHAHFSRTLTVFVCILETWNKIFLIAILIYFVFYYRFLEASHIRNTIFWLCDLFTFTFL